jgi:integrase-like protein
MSRMSEFREDAGGADLDNAWRSGPVAVTFRPATGTRGARRPARPARGAHDLRCVTAGRVPRRGAGHRRGGQRPATVRYRARGSGPSCPPTCGESPHHPPAPKHTPRSFTLPCMSRASSTRPASASRPGAPKVRPWFRAVLTAAGLDSADWTPRELRHSFVSLMSDAGVPIEKIARLVGHTGTTTTETVYRKQIRPVVIGGAEVMDSLFPRRDADA